MMPLLKATGAMSAWQHYHYLFERHCRVAGRRLPGAISTTYDVEACRIAFDSAPGADFYFRYVAARA